MNQLRKMQASFSWDWGLAAPSVGIWFVSFVSQWRVLEMNKSTQNEWIKYSRKPVVLEVYDTAIIRDVTYSLKSIDDYWKFDLTVHLECGVGSQSSRSFDGYFIIDWIDIPDIPTIERHVIISELEDDTFNQTITFSVPASLVELWWPNGFGNQTLYRLVGSMRSIQPSIFAFHNEIVSILFYFNYARVFLLLLLIFFF